MVYRPPYAKRRYTLDSVSWTTIAAPFSCDSVTIKNVDNAISVLMRTDSGDSTTEDLLFPGYQEYIQVPPNRQQWRFTVGQTIIFCKAESGTPEIVVSFNV